MYDGAISIETYLAGTGRDVSSIVECGKQATEVHCYANPIYNLGKSRRTNFSSLLLATLIL